MHADADADGAVSYIEFQAHHRAMAAEAFTGLDGDKDGRVSRPEFLLAHADATPAFKQAIERTFVALDQDGDGAVSRTELDLP